MDWEPRVLLRLILKLSHDGYGPTMNEFNHERDPMFPTAKAILKAMELSDDRNGWAELLARINLKLPKPKEGNPYGTVWGKYDVSRIPEVIFKGSTGNSPRYGAGYE